MFAFFFTFRSIAGATESQVGWHYLRQYGLHPGRTARCSAQNRPLSVRYNPYLGTSYNSSKYCQLIHFRNSPVLCDVFPQLNLQSWKTDSPALQVPEAILIQTLEKGTQGLAQRRKEEYKLWEHSKS